MIFQNEAPYLKEWIEFHKLVGVEHFYLYNNASQDNFSEVLAPYVESGIVELIDWNEVAESHSHWQLIQRGMMLDATLRAQGVSQWVAFIDADEFIFPVKDKTIPNFLKSYENCPAVAISWQTFGTSHIKNLRTDKLMIEQLVYRTKRTHPYNFFVKSIVQVDFIDTGAKLEDWNSHMLPLLDGAKTINVNRYPLRMHFLMDYSVPVDRIRINHYTFRDENFFYTTKLARADADREKSLMMRKCAKEANEVEDRSILVYADELKKIISN